MTFPSYEPSVSDSMYHGMLNSSSKTGVVIPSVVGLVILVVLIVCFFRYFSKSKRRYVQADDAQISINLKSYDNITLNNNNNSTSKLKVPLHLVSSATNTSFQTAVPHGIVKYVDSSFSGHKSSSKLVRHIDMNDTWSTSIPIMSWENIFFSDAFETEKKLL